MLWILIKNKIICLYNGYFRKPLKAKSFRYLTLAISATFFYYLCAWSNDFFYYILKNPDLNLPLVERLTLIEHVLSAGFTGFFFFLLMGGLTLSVHYIFSDSDLSLLLSTPLSTNTIFTYKVIEMTIFNSALFLFVGCSTLLGFGFGIRASINYYFVLIITLIPFILIPTTLALLLTLLAVRFVRPQRIREVSGALTGIITLGFWFVIQMFRASALNMRSPDFDPTRLKQLQDLAGETYWNYLPTGWITPIFTRFLRDNAPVAWTNIIVLYLLALILFVCCLLLIQRSYIKGITFTTISTIKKNKAPFRLENANISIIKIPSVHISIILKDIKLIVRDSRLFMQTIMLGIIMIFIPLIIQPNSASNLPPFINESYRFYFILLFSSIISAQMGSRLIPLESRSFWRLKLSPNPMRKILMGKLLLGYCVTQLLTLVSLILVALYHDERFELFYRIFIFSIPICLGASALGGLLGVLFPQFDWEHPKRMLTPMGGILLAIVSILWWIVCLASIFIPALLFDYSIHLQPINVLLSFGLALIILYGVIRWGALRLEKMEWQF